MMSHVFQIWFVSSVLYQLVSPISQNKGALQESFFTKLKTIKYECDANTANLLSVIDDLQQNENTSLINDLKQETQSLKKLVEDLNRTIGHQEETKNYLNKTVQLQQQTLQELRKTVEDQQRTIQQQNGTVEEQRNTIRQLDAMIDRLKETDVKNLKGKVEDLESGAVAQRLMISKLNESRPPGKGSLTLDKYER